mmetsp:Transcript_37679/g.91654  ORF Transcript_37679/g.91654 Transcript_37679/m.91654 type:complete len:622 (+) Transcript_37679:482-2347(+)|eukprot:CAMPEP_0113469926 /NCGR_PEP_ID=MMETSP0014_2-20120614/16166_1 /TAXON_ID=2857 /ORGANISM="Nitzschia sp." /LENGTH=621 /DNA_ID=CAMNT_0000362449 /DNA_START=454 /DNA_END=2319 /DNA_ORIENTATION=+ /assembly_acc=CAM_ASM_000159
MVVVTSSSASASGGGGSAHWKKSFSSWLPSSLLPSPATAATTAHRSYYCCFFVVLGILLVVGSAVHQMQYYYETNSSMYNVYSFYNHEPSSMATTQKLPTPTPPSGPAPRRKEEVEQTTAPATAAYRTKNYYEDVSGSHVADAAPGATSASTSTAGISTGPAGTSTTSSSSGTSTSTSNVRPETTETTAASVPVERIAEEEEAATAATSEASSTSTSSTPSEASSTLVHQFHLIWTKGDITFGKSYTPQMALETICFHHHQHRHHRHRHRIKADAGRIQINLFVMDTVHVDGRLIDQLNQQGGCNVKIQVLPRPWTAYFEDTPLRNFTSTHSDLIERGPYFYSHLTDLFRLGVLWKHGGWFVDSDVAWVRPVVIVNNARKEKENGGNFGSSGTTTAVKRSSGSKSIFKNALADEGPVYNNCISTFTKHHPFLMSVADHIQKNYNSTHYITCIQSLTSATKAWTNKCHPTTMTPTTMTGSNIKLQGQGDGNDDDADDDDGDCVTILHRTTFFPIGSPKRCRLLFERSTPTIDHKIFGNDERRSNEIAEYNNNNNASVADSNNTTGVIRTRIQKPQRQLPYAVHYFGSKNLHKMMHPNSTLYKVYRKGCIICNLPTTSTSTST